jgi:Domain of unknown function (DUF4262)
MDTPIEVGSDEWHRRVDLLTQDVKDKIETFGFTIIGVFPREDNGTCPFVYTVGLTSKGLPELILALGADLRFLSTFMNYIVEKVLENPVADIIDCDGHDIALVPLTVPHLDYPLSFAHRVYGDEVAVRQVLVSDDNGHFPSHDDFDPEILQPVLATWT